jgi:general secretion pathway protein K
LTSLLPNSANNLRDRSHPNQGTGPAPIGEVSLWDAGSVLLLALWSLCLLSVFAVYLGYGVRQKLILIERLNSRDSLHFVAEAGVKQAIAELRQKQDFEYAALNESWSNNPARFADIRVGRGEFNLAYNYLDYNSGSESTRYGLVDEERKLNLNKAALEEIQQVIMLAAGREESKALSLAAAIVDWRDSDNNPSLPGSPEDSYYSSLPNPYEAKDAAFEVFDELLLVKGMSREVFDKLKDYITIYSNGKININTASPLILLALGLQEELVDKIISFRCGADGIEATTDDNIFDSLTNIVTQLGHFSELSLEEMSSLNRLISAGKISTASSNFMARSLGQLGRRQEQVICIIDRKGEVFSWREG